MSFYPPHYFFSAPTSCPRKRRSNLPNCPLTPAFYFIWRGQPSAELRKTNSIAALWDDPGFAPVRSSITDTLLNNSIPSQLTRPPKKLPTSAHPPATRTVRFASRESFRARIHQQSPEERVSSFLPFRPAPKPTSWNGLFFIYNRSGKEDILSKAVLAMRAGEKEIPQISQITVADVPTLKVERKTGVTYWVETGKYAVSANETVVLEEILNRLNGKSPAGSLADSPAYKEAQTTLGAGQVEFFLRVPESESPRLGHQRRRLQHAAAARSYQTRFHPFSFRPRAARRRENPRAGRGSRRSRAWHSLRYLGSRRGRASGL